MQNSLRMDVGPGHSYWGGRFASDQRYPEVCNCTAQPVTTGVRFGTLLILAGRLAL